MRIILRGTIFKTNRPKAFINTWLDVGDDVKEHASHLKCDIY